MTKRRPSRSTRHGPRAAPGPGRSRPLYPKARKRLGQHFLEPAWVARLVKAIDPAPADLIVEIGPGRGALTRALLPHAARLVCIEIDDRLATMLARDVPDHVRVIHADVLSVDLPQTVVAAGGPPARVVGNLPYNVASPILFKLLTSADEGRLITDATIMLQKEVAERVTASPGDAAYGAMSIQVARLADARILLTLPPGAFRPPPRVTSAVVRLRFHAPSVDVGDDETFERIVRGVFLQRRKTMLNALASVAASVGRSAADLLDRAGIDPRLRPGQLSLEEFARLARAVL